MRRKRPIGAKYLKKKERTAPVSFDTRYNMRALLKAPFEEVVAMVKSGELVGRRYIMRAFNNERFSGSVQYLLQNNRIPHLLVDGHWLIPRDAADAVIAYLKERPPARRRRAKPSSDDAR